MKNFPISRLVGLAWLATALAGCSGVISGYPKDPADTDAVLSGLQSRYFATTSTDAYDKETDATKRKQLRDELVGGRIRAYDIEFSCLERSLYETGNALSTGGDLAALVLNGVAATTGSAETKSALAAAATGILGAQGAISKDLFYQRTLPALLAQMHADRDNIKANIFQSLQLSDADYPLWKAESDLYGLNDAGSIWVAINGLTTQATNAAAGAQADVDAVRKVQYSNAETSERLSRWLHPKGENAGADQTNVDKLTQWMTKDTTDPALGGIPWPQFVRGDVARLEADRARAIKDLNIP